MAKNNPPRPGGAPPRPGARTRPGAASRPGAVARPTARPPAGGKSWSPPGDNAPTKPKAKPPSAPPTDDAVETLRMVPLSDQDAEDQEGGKSATTFFSLPTPKRKKQDEPEAPAAAGPPPPAPGPPSGSYPPGVGPGMGSMAPGMMGGMGIQGPVAGGPVAPMGGFPQGGMPPGAIEEEISRAQSYRVFAIVTGLMFMVFSALIMTVGLAVYGLWMTAETDRERQAAVVTPPPPPRQPAVDTGIAPPPTTTPKPKPPKPGGGGGGTKPSPTPTPTPTPTPPPAPAVGPGPVTVTIPAGEPYTSIEVTCPSGYRQRANFSNGSASLPDVPREDCLVTFRGGPPARNKISGGQSKSCTFPSGSAHCT